MDMSATTTIRRSPEEVFDYVADVSHDVNWRTGIVDSGLRSQEPVGVGCVGYDATARFETVWRVTRLDPMRVDWEFIEGPLKGHGGYRLEPDADGTRFTLVADVRPSGPMRLLGPLFGWMVRRQTRADIETLRRILESEEASTAAPLTTTSTAEPTRSPALPFLRTASSRRTDPLFDAHRAAIIQQQGTPEPLRAIQPQHYDGHSAGRRRLRQLHRCILEGTHPWTRSLRSRWRRWWMPSNLTATNRSSPP